MAIRSRTFRETYHEDIKLFQTIWIKFWMGLFVFFLAILPFVGDPYIIYLMNLICVTVIATIGLNILSGYAGQISLGHAAFFAIGAYTTAILTDRFGMPFWICLPASTVLAGLVGILIGTPCLRLKGLYLAMATMAFGIGMDFVLVTWDALTGGVRGLNIDHINLFGYPLDSPEKLYYLFLFFTVLSLIVAKNLIRTKVGRAFVALRDQDVAAEIIGVNLTHYKVLAFFISSLYAGLAGGLFAYLMGYIHPEHFTFFLSIEYITIIIVGGLGTVVGTVFGTIFIILIPEIIKSLSQTISILIPALEGQYNEEWNIAAFGLLIMLFLIFEPTGLYGIWIRIKTCFKNWPFTY
ncbi:branched-chain amino acid ABC transporter permease [Thermodesulfobacteriota bacterium]